MRSLSENYRAAHGGSHETFADLIFCALVILVLFVLTLAVEVSQRIRAEDVIIEANPVVAADDVTAMTPSEMEKLSKQLLAQRRQLMELQSRLKDRADVVSEQMTEMRGQQRFTGAREPAALTIAYNYRNEKYYFVPSKDVEHADRRQSGESTFVFLARKKLELIEIASRTLRSRAYTQKEAAAIFSAFSLYNEVVPYAGGYGIEQNNIGVHYHTYLCEILAGDFESNIDREAQIVQAILSITGAVGPENNGMYPEIRCRLDAKSRLITVNEVILKPEDLRDILLSIAGRGVVIDFNGKEGELPNWLHDEVLVPAGYISQTPRLPRIN